MTSSETLKKSTTLGLYFTCKTLGSNFRGGAEDIRFTPYSLKLRFRRNFLSLRFIHNLNIRFKMRRGAWRLKGVGGARRFHREPGPAYYYSCAFDSTRDNARAGIIPSMGI